jgi:hypothetical protein
MKSLTRNKVGLILLSILAGAVLSACSNVNPPYRTFYMGDHCRYYYTDSLGYKVYYTRPHSLSVRGHEVMRDSSGRWFYDDSFGNRIYEHRRCW